MTLTALTGIVISACGVLIISMAALIKTMVVSKLNELQLTVTGLSREMHRLEIKVNKLEIEHELHCYRPTQIGAI